MSTDPMSWEVGQAVVIHSRTGTESGVVTKVARKYLTVERTKDGGRWPNPTQYHLATGRIKSDYSQDGYVETPEMAARRARRDAALQELRDLGLEPVGWRSRLTLSTDALEAGVKAMKETP